MTNQDIRNEVWDRIENLSYDQWKNRENALDNAIDALAAPGLKTENQIAFTAEFVNAYPAHMVEKSLSRYE